MQEVIRMIKISEITDTINPVQERFNSEISSFVIKSDSTHTTYFTENGTRMFSVDKHKTIKCYMSFLQKLSLSNDISEAKKTVKELPHIIKILFDNYFNEQNNIILINTHSNN